VISGAAKRMEDLEALTNNSTVNCWAKKERTMRDDLKLLQGTWSVTSLEVEGQEMPDSMLADARILIEGNHFTTTGMGAVYEGTLKLDASRRPPQVDMKFDEGPEKGNTNLGIYKLDGDTWKLCLATRGSVRPSKFESTPGSGFALETLTRGKRAAAKRVQPQQRSSKSAAATEFEGEWKMVSAVMDGNPMEESAVQWVRRVTIGDEITVTAGPQVLMKMTFKHDPSRSPKAIDYVNTKGSNKGKTQLGIYEFDGDLLKICMGAAGSPRPSKFESVRGDGSTFTVWKR
jgi:uncharacterized protein (TIGR03067 family)